MHHIKAVIFKRNGKKRAGKGFSPNEVKQAGLNFVEAAKIGLPVDQKRKTAHDLNVENIKAFKAHMETHKAQEQKHAHTHA